MAVTGDAAGENAGGVYAAAYDGGADAVGEEEGSGDGAITESHRTVYELGEEAGEGHDAKGAGIESFWQGSYEFGEAVEGEEGEDGVAERTKHFIYGGMGGEGEGGGGERETEGKGGITPK